MSGIAGVVYTDQRPVEAAVLDAMIQATQHLGIDGRFTWLDGPAGLIRFSLATTPEAVGQDGPHLDLASRTVIVFDGRLDNREELLALLGRDGLPRSSPDSAIALALHARLGDDFLSRLVGDYALAIWDPARQRLFCARSPIGWRPLLWTVQGNRFAFASEPSTLIRGLQLDRRLNEGAIGEHLAARFVTETDTFWQGVQRLPPGQALVLQGGAPRTWRWHEGPFEDLSRLSDDDHIDRFMTLLDQSLIAVTRSAGPVASHLSGGLDSSSVVCRLRQLVEAGQVDEMVETVSARFPGDICDEGEWIAAVEAHCGLSSHMTHNSPFDSAVAAQWSADTLHLPLRPNANATVVGTCDRLNARGARVLLSGEGGDDWMNGSAAHWPDLFADGRWAALMSEIVSVQPGRGWAGNLRAFLGQGLGPLVSPSRRARLLRPHLDFSRTAPPWISPDWAREIRLTDRWRAAPEPPVLGGFAQAQRYQVYALARRHVNVDNSVAYLGSRGVEVRHPLHDLRLTRFFMGAAGRMLRRDGRKKHLLREAMRGTLPELVRNRTGKANISPPIIDGVAARLAERPFEEMQCVKRGWVDAGMLTRFHEAHTVWRQAGDATPAPGLPYAPVWNALAIDLWLENILAV